MKNLLLISIFIFSIAFSKANPNVLSNLMNVNQEWKNQKYKMEELERVDANSVKNFNQWISTHLLLVENILRNRDLGSLSKSQKENRLFLLDRLKEYAQAKTFPINNYIPIKNPVFIDEKGTHCAVGYLMQQSGNDALAQTINKNEKFAYVKQIKTPGVLDWARTNGFSLDELAWIQPGYPPSFSVSPLQEGLNGTVNSMVLSPNEGTIYAGGSFTSAVNGVACNNIAAYTNGFAGFSWISLGNGVNGTVHKIIQYNNKLIVGGEFNSAGSINALHVAAYDLASGMWEPMGLLDGIVKTFVVYNNELYAGGSFTGLLAKWNGSSWQQVPEIAIYGNEVRTFELFNNNLIIGGDFELPTGALRKNVVAFDGTQLLIYGFGTKTPVNDFEIYNGKLYAACDFVSGNDTCALASFVNDDWQTIFGNQSIVGTMGNFLNGTIKQLTTDGNDILACGDFFVQSGMTYGNNFMRYTETSQDTISEPLMVCDSTINCMNVLSNNIYFGGAFTNSFSTVLNHVGSLAYSGPTKVPSINNPPKFMLFPNPCNNWLYLELGPEKTKGLVNIFDSMGRLVGSQEINGNKIQLQISELPKGIYVIQLTSNYSIQSSTFVKE